MKQIELRYRAKNDAQKIFNFFKKYFSIENLSTKIYNFENIKNIKLPYKEKGIHLDDKGISIIAKKIAKIEKYDDDDDGLYNTIDTLFEKLGRSMDTIEISEFSNWDHWEDNYNHFNKDGKKVILIALLKRFKKGLDLDLYNDYREIYDLIDASYEISKTLKCIDRKMKGATHLNDMFDNFLHTIISIVEKGEFLKQLEENANAEIETNRVNLEKAKEEQAERKLRQEIAIKANKTKGGLYDRGRKPSLWFDIGELLYRKEWIRRGKAVRTTYHDDPDYIDAKLKKMYKEYLKVSKDIEKFNNERHSDDPLWEAINRAEEGHRKYKESMREYGDKPWVVSLKKRLFTEFLEEFGEEFE